MNIQAHLFQILAIWIVLSVFIGCSHKKPSLTLRNESDIARTDEPIVLRRDEFIQKTGKIPQGKSPLLLNTEGDTIPSQLDDINGDQQWDELAFLVNIDSNTERTLSVHYVKTNDYPEFTPRTNIRLGVKDDAGIHNKKELTMTRDELPVPVYQMFQMDGPAWENDKIGFRHYIDGRNARDLFGKTSAKMVLDTVGISPEGTLVNNYNKMEYWGRDILSVGNSLGIGGLAMMNKGTPVRLGVRAGAPKNNVDTTEYKLITQGPVRTIYTLTYKDWHVNSKTYDLENKIFIWGGHYWYGSEVMLHNAGQTDTLVVGLVNSNNDKPLMVLNQTGSGWIGLATHDKQTINKGGYLGLALILPKKYYMEYRKAPGEGPGITTSYNALLAANGSSPLKYYVLAGWEISDKKFADRAYFKKFIQNELAKIQYPVSVQ